MTKSLRIGLLIIFLFQLWTAQGFELAHDEAYYWLYSKHLDWGFFDHPPLVGAVIKLFSFLPDSELAVRLGFILLQFLTFFILLNLTNTPLVSFLLFFSFPLASFAGLLALPDIPLLFMSACYCLGLKRYFEKDSWQRAVALGFIIALLFYAKYHGVLLVFFTMVAVPTLFLRRSFYIVAGVALVCFTPHMLWQYQHEFSTLRYHFIERPSSSFSLKRSLEFIGLEVILAGVFVGPIVWWQVVRNKTKTHFDRSMKVVSIGTVLFFLFSTFSKKPEANWTIFLAAPLIYLVSDLSVWQKKWVKVALSLSFTLVIILRIAFVLPPEFVPIKRATEFHGWSKWAQELDLKCSTPILANNYQLASKLSYYLKRDIGALNYRSRKNQFDYWRFDKNIPTGEVCYLTDKSDFSGEKVILPDGKSMILVKNQDLEELWALKYMHEDR